MGRRHKAPWPPSGHPWQCSSPASSSSPCCWSSAWAPAAPRRSAPSEVWLIVDPPGAWLQGSGGSSGWTLGGSGVGPGRTQSHTEPETAPGSGSPGSTARSLSLQWRPGLLAPLGLLTELLSFRDKRKSSQKSKNTSAFFLFSQKNPQMTEIKSSIPPPVHPPVARRKQLPSSTTAHHQTLDFWASELWVRVWSSSSVFIPFPQLREVWKSSHSGKVS